jgi:hypothetical protein
LIILVINKIKGDSRRMKSFVQEVTTSNIV